MSKKAEDLDHWCSYNGITGDNKAELVSIFIDSTTEQPNNDSLITVEFLLKLHPELSPEEALDLKEFSNSCTIRYKECYGNGSIIYPKWKESKHYSK
jgi:hypothetical protein